MGIWLLFKRRASSTKNLTRSTYLNPFSPANDFLHDWNRSSTRAINVYFLSLMHGIIRNSPDDRQACKPMHIPQHVPMRNTRGHKLETWEQFRVKRSLCHGKISSETCVKIHKERIRIYLWTNLQEIISTTLEKLQIPWRTSSCSTIHIFRWKYNSKYKTCTILPPSQGSRCVLLMIKLILTCNCSLNPAWNETLNTYQVARRGMIPSCPKMSLFFSNWD